MSCGPSVGLLAALVGLLTAAAAGLAQSPASPPAGWSAPAPAWYLVVAPALGWAAALTLVLTRTAPRPRYPRALRSALLLEAVLLTVAAALLARTGVGASGAGAPGERGGLPFDLPLPPPVALPLDPRVLVVFFALVVAVGLGLMLWSVWEVRDRFFRPRGRRLRDPRYGRGRAVRGELDATLAAVRRARAALAGDEDARRAVIAAYAAVERAVTERGADRRASQTPAEFLHAVLANGTLGARAEVEALLALFHRARFASAPLGEPDRDEAVRLLDALDDDLAAGARR